MKGRTFVSVSSLDGKLGGVPRRASKTVLVIASRTGEGPMAQNPYSANNDYHSRPFLYSGETRRTASTSRKRVVRSG